MTILISQIGSRIPGVDPSALEICKLSLICTTDRRKYFRVRPPPTSFETPANCTIRLALGL